MTTRVIKDHVATVAIQSALSSTVLINDFIALAALLAMLFHYTAEELNQYDTNDLKPEYVSDTEGNTTTTNSPDLQETKTTTSPGVITVPEDPTLQY